jgi:leucyl-tRNA synthetase
MGKLRGTIELTKELNKEQIIEKAKKIINVASYLENKTIVKIIYIPNKILNFVIK